MTELIVTSSALAGASDGAEHQALRRFLSHRLAVAGAVVLVAIALVAILAPVLSPRDAEFVDVAAALRPPDSTYLLGTDEVGRDVLARILFGARTSLIVGFGAVGIAIAIGLALGLAAGLGGKVVDAIVMRITDAVLSVPPLLMVIIFVAVVGPSLGSVVVVIALTTWPAMARLVRGQVLTLREREFVTASRTVGVSRTGIVVTHIIPNLMGPLSVVATFGVAEAILVEAGLSFLGLGVRPPTPSWGEMVSAAQSASILLAAPWVWVPPSVMIGLTVLAVNFVGDGLRDALDPKGSK